METSEREAVLKILGMNVRAARKRAGKSQERLAFDAELDRTYIGGIERGERNVSVMNLVRIARTLGVAAHTLLEGIEDGEISVR